MVSFVHIKESSELHSRIAGIKTLTAMQWPASVQLPFWLDELCWLAQQVCEEDGHGVVHQEF